LKKGDEGGFAVAVDTQTLKIPLNPPLQRGKWNTEITCHTNNFPLWKRACPEFAEGAANSLLKFAMLIPGELISCHFPLWKRACPEFAEGAANSLLKFAMLIPGELTASHFPLRKRACPEFAEGAANSLLKFAMLIPGELNTSHFPLWKRGIKGDLQSLLTRKR